jgi:hypothetical protein
MLWLSRRLAPVRARSSDARVTRADDHRRGTSEPHPAPNGGEPILNHLRRLRNGSAWNPWSCVADGNTSLSGDGSPEETAYVSASLLVEHIRMRLEPQ